MNAGVGQVIVKPIDPTDHAFVCTELRKHWLATQIWSRDKPFDADQLPGYVAMIDGVRVGHITVFHDHDEHEIITLSSASEDRGVGSALMQAAEDGARRQHCVRIFLTTTNDNLRALRFYQRRGWRLVAIHHGMIDRYRVTTPAIPVVGMNGIPLHDELELELPLARET